MTTPTHPYDSTPVVTSRHLDLASKLLAEGGRSGIAAALAAAEQQGAERLAATITLHAKDAGEASAIYAARVSALAGRRDGASRAAAAEAAVRAGQASAVQQALRGVLSA